MSIQLFKCLLSKDFFNTWGTYVTQEMFPRELQPLFNQLINIHNNYEGDISTSELLDLYVATHPTITGASFYALQEIVSSLDELPPYNPEIAKEVISASFKADISRKMIQEIADIEAGVSNDWSKVNELYNSVVSLNDLQGITSVKEYEDGIVSLDNIEEHINLESISGDWKFNIPDVQRKTTGLYNASFTISGARPEAGKSALAISLSCAPNGFIHQGANVHIWRNEEQYQAMARRAVSCILQKPIQDLALYKDQFQAIKDTIQGSLSICKDSITLQADITKLVKYLEACSDLDILIIDQIDNMRINGKVARNDVGQLEELYATIREVAIDFNIPIIGLTQAGAEADNKLYFGYGELYGSRTGKAATADTILCIGHQRPQGGQDDTGYRMINYAKNKFGGAQSSTPCVLNGSTSTFTE